jgi:hypothetical protein
MIGINRPAVRPHLGIVASDLCALQVAVVVALTDALKVVEVEEQFRVAFVRLDVVNDRRVVTCAPAPQEYAAAFVLASVAVP